MKRKILIVDDDADMRDMTRKALSGLAQVEVLTAAEGRTALELISREQPCLVFLDIKMPGISGLEVMKSLKAKKCIPVVWMLTGVEDLNTAMKALQLGANGYLTKPFRVSQLKAIVSNVIGNISGNKKCAKQSDKPWRVKKKTGVYAR